MKVLEMIDLIEKHNMQLDWGTNRIAIKNRITDRSLLEECRHNRKYFLMLLKLRNKFDYFKDVLKTHSKEVTDKQVLYFAYMCEQDVYVNGTERNFDTTTREEMQELIRMMEQSCDRVAFK